MNEIDFLNVGSLDDFDILNVLQQFKHIALAHESIKAMYDESIIAIPLHADQSCIYWCVERIINKDSSEAFIVTTFYEIKTAGEITSMTTKRIKPLPILLRIFKDRIGILLADQELDNKVDNLKSRIPKINIPNNFVSWLRDVRSAI